MGSVGFEPVSLVYGSKWGGLIHQVVCQLKLPVAAKTRPMDTAYREQVNSGFAVDESAFQAHCTITPEISKGLFAAYAAIVVGLQDSHRIN